MWSCKAVSRNVKTRSLLNSCGKKFLKHFPSLLRVRRRSSHPRLLGWKNPFIRGTLCRGPSLPKSPSGYSLGAGSLGQLFPAGGLRLQGTGGSCQPSAESIRFSTLPFQPRACLSLYSVNSKGTILPSWPHLLSTYHRHWAKKPRHL